MTLPPGQVPDALTIRSLLNILRRITETSQACDVVPSTAPLKASPQGAPEPKGGPTCQLAPGASVSQARPTIKLLKSPVALSLGFVHDCPSLGRTSLNTSPRRV